MASYVRRQEQKCSFQENYCYEASTAAHARDKEPPRDGYGTIGSTNQASSVPDDISVDYGLRIASRPPLRAFWFVGRLLL